MFTGIVEATGRVERSEPGPSGGRRLAVATTMGPFAIGESIATNGVCLTVVASEGDRFEVDVGPETLDRTTLGELAVGDALNLERSVTPSTRLGGHLVQGHVDAVGTVRSVEARDNAFDIWFDAPNEVLRLVIPRGSVTVDGVSLTVVDRDIKGFSACIIPHTWDVTVLRERPVGAKVNLEADLLARYIEGLLDQRREA